MSRRPLQGEKGGVSEATVGDIPRGSDYLYHLDGRDRSDEVCQNHPEGLGSPLGGAACGLSPLKGMRDL